MSRTGRSDGDGLASVAFAGGPRRLDLWLMSTPQVVRMSPKSSIPQAALSDSHVLMPDTAGRPAR